MTPKDFIDEVAVPVSFNRDAYVVQLLVTVSGRDIAMQKTAEQMREVLRAKFENEICRVFKNAQEKLDKVEEI